MNGTGLRLLLLMTLTAIGGGTVSVAANDSDLKSESAEHSAPFSYVEPEIDPVDREHWSFLPAIKPQLEAGDDRNPIDTLIDRGLHKAGLTRTAKAADRVLLRRICLNLTGLPPTVAQLNRSSAKGLQLPHLVDELLQSPRYGEHWAQHWLDLARFAETDGFEHDKIRPDAWKYRDWVINAFNDDLPYDEFLRRQLAGDELYPDDPQAAVATMFLLSGPDMPDINLPEERRHNVLNELTGTLGEVVLGLQIGCAQCHDHKYDPVSQADFYRLRAVFEPSLQLKKNKSLRTLAEAQNQNKKSWLMLRGDFRRRGPPLQPNVLRALSRPGQYRPQRRDHTAGLRTALANWLVRPDHPLTARVIVNRIWQQHFGRALVDTPSDFGLVGSVPDHPELLDLLAVWLVEHDWSLKQLHRLILTSETWQQQSYLPAHATDGERDAWQTALNRDPDLRLLSRFPSRRLTGEVIRDGMLAAAGQLNLKMGGPGVRPPLPPELKQTLLKNQWNVTEDSAEHHRRSIYIFARRNLRFPIFETFDRPSANSSCAVRQTSTTAPQALYLLNSEFSWAAAQQTARQIVQQTDVPDQQVVQAWQKILLRLPKPEERVAARQLLTRQLQISQSASEPFRPHVPVAHLCLSLFNSNEFLFVD